MSIYEGHGVTLHHGDCLDVLRSLPDASVDSVVTDPPYGLEFMGKDWDAPWKASAGSWADRDATDHAQPENRGQTSSPFLAAKVNKFAAGLPFQQWCEAWATECLRVLKPGGMIAAFGGTRTFHRLACAIEDAGFEIRDSIAWLYGSGFPKSLDVSKAIDKAQGATGTYGEPKSAAHAGWIDRGRMRGDEGEEGWQRPWMQDEGAVSNAARRYLPGSTEAQAFAGWGTALKPAFEPVVVARKPLVGTVAANVLAHGTGALNIDATRIGTTDNLNGGGYSGGTPKTMFSGLGRKQPDEFVQPSGRWPANVVLDESQAEALDEQSGTLTSGANPTRRGADGDRQAYGEFGGQDDANPQRGADSGGASRFFFIAREDNPCHSTSSASTVESPSSHPRGPADSAPSDAATTACPDGERLTGSPSTSETPSASRPSVESGTTPTMSTAGASSPDWKPGEPSQMVSRARYAASLSRTATTTTTTSPSSSAGSVDPTTSSTTQASAPGVPLDELGSRFNYVAKADASERPRYTRPMVRLRADLTPAQVDHVRARLAEAGVQVD